MLESVAANTNVILPPRFMNIVKAAIKRDGLALARVPPRFEEELIRFGAQDPIGMLKFRVSCFPLDSSSWKILDVCLLAIVERLEAKNQRIVLNNSINEAYSQISYNRDDYNVFRDILLTLMRRLWVSMMEIAVCHFSNHNRTRTILIS
jgi:hypothetical protein